MNEQNSKTTFKNLVKTAVSPNKPSFYFGLMIAVIVTSFFMAFWWMPSLWFVPDSYSPGPMAPIMLGFILFFKCKRVKKKVPITPILKGLGIVIGISMAIFMFGWKNPDKLPLNSVVVPAAFCLLFVIITGLFFHVSAIVNRELSLSDKGSSKKLAGLFGWAMVVFSLLVHFLATRGDLPRLSIMSYMGVMTGLIMVIFGWQTTKHMLFPILFLLFMVPWSFIDDYLGGPLRIFATTTAVGTMKIFGMGVTKVGTTMSIGDMNFSVSAACSGLRSLMALSALGATFAFVTQPTTARKYFVALSAIPIAILANVMRLIGVAIFAILFGQKAAMTIFHDNAAIFLYIIATLLLFSVDKLFKVQWLKIEDW